MGYSLVNILDPQTQVDTTVVAMFHQTVAFLLSFSLTYIIDSSRHRPRFEYLSPGAVHLNRGLTLELLHRVAGVLKPEFRLPRLYWQQLWWRM
jgi:flagellar biosynthetic protein FliR